jgi:hypothetical protein
MRTVAVESNRFNSGIPTQLLKYQEHSDSWHAAEKLTGTFQLSPLKINSDMQIVACD